MLEVSMNKTIFITSGSTGIGIDLCKFYLNEGFIVGTCSIKNLNFSQNLYYFQVSNKRHSMPFLIVSKKAARLIADTIKKRKTYISFLFQ